MSQPRDETRAAETAVDHAVLDRDCDHLCEHFSHKSLHDARRVERPSREEPFRGPLLCPNPTDSVPAASGRASERGNGAQRRRESLQGTTG